MNIANSSSEGLARGDRLTRRAWHTRAALPMVAWMVATALLVVLHRGVPRQVWLLVHFVTLGIASNAIVVWSNHFVDAVLRSPRQGHRREVWQLALLNSALVLLSIGIIGQWSLPVWAGVAAVAAMAVSAVASIARQARSSLPARFAHVVVWYQGAAACLVVGAILGGLMAVPFGRWADAILASHLAFNVLGWVGLTIWGTLCTLWPTMLRTKAPDRVERAARAALPLMVLGIVAMGASPLLHPVAPVWWRIIGAVGVVAYATGVFTQAEPILHAWLGKRVSTFPILSVGAGQVWLVGWLGWLLWRWMASASPAILVEHLRGSVPVLLVGFLLQVLLGALAYLVPVVLGGGPAMVRGTTASFERGAVARWAVVNISLALFLLPLSSVWKVTTSLSAFGALVGFLVVGWQAWRVRGGSRPAPGASPHPHRVRRGLAWAMVWVLLAASLAAVVDPVSFRAQFSGVRSSAQGVSETGRTREVEVMARGMRFSPDVITVDPGDRLVIRLTNGDDGMIHDLVMATGATSGRLSPGQSATVDLGVVGQSTDGWCSVAGHRQMGMTLQVQTSAGTPSASASAHPGHAVQEPAADTPTLDLSQEYSSDWKPRDPVLAPASKDTVHKVTLTVTDEVMEVAPGVRQTMWTFNKSAPGPVLRGRVGDVFEITLVNNGGMGHGIDFHAGALAPDRPMRTIAPGESLVYRFTAKRAGIWMYHCSTMPMTQHIANGMYGAVVIDPPDLPKVDREYLLVQGEQYYGADADGAPGVADMGKIMAEKPDAVVFNGFPGQYDKSPLPAKVGERVRFWVLDAGPNRAWAFHIVGAQFDTVWFEGAWRLRNGTTPGVPGATSGGSQTLGMLASQGGFVETSFPEAGHYALVNHQMVDAERGAHGIVQVR